MASMGVMPPARRCRLLAAAGVATLLVAAPTPAVAQDTFPGRDRIAELLEERLYAKAVPVEEVVRFSIRASDLAVSSDMKADVSGVREIRLRGMPGTTRVQVGTRFREPMGLTPYFDLNHTVSSDDGTTSPQTRVYAL